MLPTARSARSCSPCRAHTGRAPRAARGHAFVVGWKRGTLLASYGITRRTRQRCRWRCAMVKRQNGRRKQLSDSLRQYPLRSASGRGLCGDCVSDGQTNRLRHDSVHRTHFIPGSRPGMLPSGPSPSGTWKIFSQLQIRPAGCPLHSECAAGVTAGCVIPGQTTSVAPRPYLTLTPSHRPQQSPRRPARLLRCCVPCAH
eukprot:4977617-Prymnesium_polylepis.1